VGHGIEDGLEAVESGGVVEGTVVMNLAPLVIDEAVNARGAES
jgi:hypothetical protein